MSEKYRKFLRIVGRFIPRERIYTDPLRRLAWGTDAGFYRLVPQIVVRSVDEQEVVRLLRTARSLGLPVTFRAAGTSLSGQTVSDSILVVAGKHWERYEVLDGGDAIRLQPGIVGAQVNRILKPYGRRFSPDPASVASAMVGGIFPGLRQQRLVLLGFAEIARGQRAVGNSVKIADIGVVVDQNVEVLRVGADGADHPAARFRFRVEILDVGDRRPLRSGEGSAWLRLPGRDKI